ncbi:aldehyde dehydrogenase [Thalassospira sp.]|uniref:aldehyde dehydrogenase family protein n=1 Tax=Thalassospira sp. TaxID=1912094 RepID=UPI0027339F47|nr:aldehyde dehydrogenase family protein [Thalassospira sp.]MDP2699837.1 aldehyde dehydrogenase family protein [Thalassospira sp.]
MSLSFDPDRLALPTGHFIGGRLMDAAGVLEMKRPSDGVSFAACPVADANIVDMAVENAKAAWRANKWGSMRPRDRARLIHRFADLMEKEAVKLAQLEAVASTRPIGQLIEGDIAVTAEQIRFFAEFADKEGSDLVPTDGDHLGMTMSEPYGVVGAITPWNVPISMAGWKVGAALAAGNAVVLKPSEMTPFSTLYMAELAVRAGIPAGIFNVVLGDGPTTGSAMTAHPDIAKISFTGSTMAGAAIMTNIARHGIRPMTLELGGKSPQLVFADADIEKAAAAIAQSLTANAGQACVSGSRLLVDGKIAAELVDAICGHLLKVQPGFTWDERTQYSPIISERQIRRIDGLVAQAMDDGGECLLGGHQMDHPGYFYAPTILTGVTQQSPAIIEEIFGPVLTVQEFADEQEALELADHPVYGLAAGVFTKDLSRAVRVTRQLQAGTVWVNRYGRSRDHILPTGGYKRSGIGKDLGREAYLANRQTKSVLISL